MKSDSISTIMTKNVVCVSHQQKIVDVKHIYEKSNFHHHIPVTKNNKLVILPDFLTKIEFKNLKKIELNYSINTSFSDAYRFVNQFYIQAYNSVFKGNETLENELYHSLRLRYNQFKMYRGISIYANINYTKKIRGIKNAVNYQGINQYLSPLLIKNQDEKWSFNGNLEKKISVTNFFN